MKWSAFVLGAERWTERIALSKGFYGFGTTFFDLENDGDVDLYWLGSNKNMGAGPGGDVYPGVGRLLRKSNCTHVYMGIECGNNEVASKLLKRATKNEKIIEATEIFHRNKIKIITLNIVGLPIKNPLEVDLETLDFNIKLKPNFAWSSILYPYPGTEIGELATNHGYFDANFEKVNVSNKSKSSMNLGDKKLNRKINNLQKLMGLIVQFPFLRPFTKFLISLPLDYFYMWVFFAFYGYKVTLRQSSFKGIMKNIINYLAFYFKYVSRLEKKVKFSSNLGKKSLSLENINNLN